MDTTSLSRNEGNTRAGRAASSQARVSTKADDTGGEIAGLLLMEKYLTDEQLTYARRVQSKLLSAKTLLDIIQELGYVTNEQIREVLRKNRVQIRIGALLRELGHISEADLTMALNLQKESREKKKLGDILIEGGFIEERRFTEILSYQLGFPLIEVELKKIDRGTLSENSLRYCKEHDLIPVGRENGNSIVAFADPLDNQGRQIAAGIFGREFIPAIATKKSIRETIAAFERNRGRSGTEVADENTVIGILNGIIEDAIREKASDIHIEPMKDRLRVRFRMDGVLMHNRDLPMEIAPALSSRIKVLARANITEKRRHQDGRILFESRDSGHALDMRVSFYITIHGEKIVLRLLNRKGELLDIKELGMSPRMLERFCLDAIDVPNGVMIVTGPTGSGKTTTLYSCVNYLNDMQSSIITAEDPVEYVIDGISQCSINPKIGLTFEETLRHIVRQDPDVIVLGEIRDAFSAETAIQAALTGHKVLTTFHTEDSIGGLVRLLNMNIEAFLISSTVVCVVAQRLLRHVCPACAEPYVPTSIEMSRIGYSGNDLIGAEFRIGRGCRECRFSGYRGRVGIFELLVMNEMVKDAILTKKSSYEIRRISIETSGLVTLLEDGLVKAAKGLVSLQEVLRQLPRLGKPRPLHELRRLLGEQ
jgi:type IV pilus assembly protein PilB